MFFRFGSFLWITRHLVCFAIVIIVCDMSHIANGANNVNRTKLLCVKRNCWEVDKTSCVFKDQIFEQTISDDFFAYYSWYSSLFGCVLGCDFSKKSTHNLKKQTSRGYLSLRIVSIWHSVIFEKKQYFATNDPLSFSGSFLP